jgi:hypothetical protein
LDDAREGGGEGCEKKWNGVENSGKGEKKGMSPKKN